ncbi:MAG: metallophosphoesterase [Planctomycetota bacterium]|nr:metallophosphoesterase [Planctomycetota bacterium]
MQHRLIRCTSRRPRLTGPGKPWSDKPVLNDPQRFHFAVMSDNTGGHRPGVWMHAVRNLNLLRPEFVVSVGDLIEGYSEDEAQVENEWQEFLGFIDQLQMKFFFVAGNHDLTNPLMHQIWRKHFGPEWYSFDYQGVHFVCLCSEDPESTLGSQQLAWVEQDLAEHKDARWTFLFVHKPLWVYAETELAAGNSDTTHWKRIESWLGNRPHTVFAGHAHQYVQFERNGRQYYQLATTGGASGLRGQKYGEFDHVTWVTMEPDGPHIANLLLDGILAPDVVTEASIGRFRRFLGDVHVAVAPILVEASKEVQSAEILVDLSNQFDRPVSVEGRVQGIPLQGLTMEPERFAIEIPPHGHTLTTVRFRLESPLDLELFRQMAVTATIRSVEDVPLAAELTLPVVVDRNYPCPQVAVTLDGDLSEWTATELVYLDQPPIFGAANQWQGKQDASLRFRVAFGGERLYLAGEVFDDRVVPDRDSLVFGLDARLLSDRQKDPRLGDNCYAIELIPTDKPPYGKLKLESRRDTSGAVNGAEFAVAMTRTGYRFEIGVPISLITKPQGAEWSGFQLNAVLRDVDDAEDQDVQILWRPAQDVRSRNTNYGFFYRSAEQP